MPSTENAEASVSYLLPRRWMTVFGKVADLSEKGLEPRGGKPVRARQEPDALRVKREINGLSDSGTNLN